MAICINRMLQSECDVNNLDLRYLIIPLAHASSDVTLQLSGLIDFSVYLSAPGVLATAVLERLAWVKNMSQDFLNAAVFTQVTDVENELNGQVSARSQFFSAALPTMLHLSDQILGRAVFSRCTSIAIYQQQGQ